MVRLFLLVNPICFLLALRTGAACPEEKISPLRAIADRIISKGRAGISDNGDLRREAHWLLEDHVTQLDASGRQRFMVEALGDKRYEDLSGLLGRQLESTDGELIQAALLGLGPELFVTQAIEEIKRFALSSDAIIQLSALQALAALDVQGARTLLYHMLKSPLLDDLNARITVRALYVSNDPLLEAYALGVIEKGNRGPTVIRELIPLITRRSDRLLLMGNMLKSEKYRPPEVETLDLDGMSRVKITYECLGTVASSRPYFLGDDELLKAVEYYAKSRLHSQLYTSALLALEKSGKSIEFFEEMRAAVDTPEEKRRVLEKVIRRIQGGERLKYEAGTDPDRKDRRASHDDI